MAREDLATVRAAFEAFNRHDREAMKRLSSEEIEIVPLRAALEGIVYRGPDAVDRFWDASDESWSEVSIDVQAVEQGSDGVFVHGRVRGVGRETGAPVEMELGWVIVLHEGSISRMATHTDVDEARRRAGLA